MPTLDRRLKKIETMCHCEITIDSVNKKTSRKLLDVYHLIEVYYDEVTGNHEGCIRMFNELLKDFGNMQTVITVTKSKDGRIYKRNYMSDSTFYQLIQNSKLYSLNTETEKEIIPEDRKLSVSCKLISMDSVKLSNDLIVAEIIEENISTTVRSYEIEQFTKTRSDDQLFHHIALSRSMTNDLKQVKVLDRSSKILTTFENYPEVSPAIIPNYNSEFNLFATSSLEIDEEYVSAISSLSSVFSSSSTTFDDAQSQSSIEDPQHIEDKCSSFFNAVDQFGFEQIPSKNFINMVIDDICRECFFEQSKVIKNLLLVHIRNIQFVTLQYLECLVEEVMEMGLINISIYSFSEENDLWNQVIESFVKIVNHSLWDIIRKSSEEAVSDDTEYITMENLIKQIMSSGMSSTGYEIDSIDNKFEDFPRSTNSTYESFETGLEPNSKNIEIIINQSNNNNSMSIQSITHQEMWKTHLPSRVQLQNPLNNVSKLSSEVKTVIDPKIFNPLNSNINQNINNKMKKNCTPSSGTDNVIDKATGTKATKSLFKSKMIILYKEVSEILANSIKSHVKLTSISLIANECDQNLIQNAIPDDNEGYVNNLIKYKFQRILNNQVEDLCFQNIKEIILIKIRSYYFYTLSKEKIFDLFSKYLMDEISLNGVPSFSLDLDETKIPSLASKILSEETTLEYCENSSKQLKETFLISGVYFVDIYTGLQETVNLSIAVSCNQTESVHKIAKRSSSKRYSTPRMHEIVYWVVLKHILNYHQVLIDEVVDINTKKNVINLFKEKSLWYRLCNFDKSLAVNIVNEILYLISFDDLVYKEIFPKSKCRFNQLQVYKYVLVNSLKIAKAINRNPTVSKFKNSLTPAKVVNLGLGYQTEKIRTHLPKSEINEIRISDYDTIKSQHLFNRITSSSESESFFSAKEIENFDRQSFENRVSEMKKGVTVTYENQSNEGILHDKMTYLWFNPKDIFNNVLPENYSNTVYKSKRTGYFGVLGKRRKITISNVGANKLFKIRGNRFEDKIILCSHLMTMGCNNKRNFTLCDEFVTQNNNNILNDLYFNFDNVEVIKKLYFSNMTLKNCAQNTFFRASEIWRPPAMKFQNISNHVHYYIYEMNLPFLEKTTKETFLTQPPLLTSLFKKMTNPDYIISKHKNPVKASKATVPDVQFAAYLSSKEDDFNTCFDLSASESSTDYFTVEATESIIKTSNERFDFDYFSEVLRRFLRGRKKSKGESQIKIKKNLNQNSTNALVNLKLESYPFGQKNMKSLKLLAEYQKQALRIGLSKLFPNESVSETKSVNQHLKMKLHSKDLEKNTIKCSRLSVIVLENMDTIFKQIIDIKFKMELAKKCRIRSTLVFAVSSAFGKIYISEAESTEFYKNENIVLNIIYEHIVVNLKSISSLCCIALDIENILKRTYVKIYRDMLSKILKTNEAINVSIE